MRKLLLDLSIKAAIVRHKLSTLEHLGKETLLEEVQISSDSPERFKIGKVLKFFKQNGYKMFPSGAILIANPTLNPSTIRYILAELVKQNMLEVVNKGSKKGRGQETIYRFKS